MVVSSNVDQYDWATEVQKFDESKSGVKGLVHEGVEKIPKFFEHTPESLDGPELVKSSNDVQIELPVIDFQGAFELGSARRKEVVKEISKAAHEWGFFQIVNHGVPLETMDAMLDAVKQFHEQPVEEKKEFYSADVKKTVKFMSNRTLLENHPAGWRDILACTFVDDQVYPEELPACCREEVLEYLKHAIHLRELLAELFSVALGLNSDYLSQIECMKNQSLACLYYPVRPEPEKTFGRGRHSDTTFLTLVMQYRIGGLQIVYDNQWMNVPPKRGALIVNIGDPMQIISNDKFITVQLRVLSQSIGPRISVACFFSPSREATGKPLAPIKDILSDENPPLYREFMFMDYLKHYKGNKVPFQPSIMSESVKNLS